MSRNMGFQLLMRNREWESQRTRYNGREHTANGRRLLGNVVTVLLITDARRHVSSRDLRCEEVGAWQKFYV